MHFYVLIILLYFWQSDESDESSEEETATGDKEESLSDGMKIIFVLQED